MIRRTKLALLALALILGATIATIEIHHHYRFGHFVPYGVHLDLVRGNSDVGVDDTYFAELRNFSFTSFDIQGCRLPGGFAGSGILYRWNVQRWNAATQSWDSLRGADTWVSRPFGGYWDQEPCSPEMTHIRPLTSRKVAWVFLEWVTTSDPVRMAIHTSVTAPPDKQQILYTEQLVVLRMVKPRLAR